MTDFAQLSFLNNRRALVMRSSGVLGLEAVRATPGNFEASEGSRKPWFLWLTFLPKEETSSIPGNLEKENIFITFGEHPATSIQVLSIVPQEELGALIAGLDETEVPDFAENLVAVRILRDTAEAEDIHNLPVYVFNLRGLEEVDRFFSSADFVFGERGREILPPIFGRDVKEVVSPEIDYLSKDYTSFRTQMLHNMSLFVPTWKERHPADLGVTIVEALAHSADYLSYYQDAVGTEAYLETARLRVSVARHARLLGYRLNEGCNARAWVQVKIEYDEGAKEGTFFPLPSGTELLTYAGRFPGAIDLGSEDYEAALAQGAAVFQTMEPVFLRPEHNSFDIYAWGSDEYLLERGATSATLVGHWDRLRAGDVLVFEQQMSLAPILGGSPDPRKRYVVRLKEPVRTTHDATNCTPENPQGTPITEIAWFDEDALPADLPVAAARKSQNFMKLTVVRGNIVLADYGRTVVDELPEVREGFVYRPRIRTRPMTWSVAYRPRSARRQAAARVGDYVSWQACPSIYLLEHVAEPPPLADCLHGVDDVDRLGQTSEGYRWSARRDLLTSGPFARDFVVETREDGSSDLRFGDGRQGEAPIPGRRFTAVYRLGNGPEGNVGPNSIRHVVLTRDVRRKLSRMRLCIVEAENYLPGFGGILRESTEHARLIAPQAVEPPIALERCVIAEDYVAIAERHPLVLDAVAKPIWTGTWTETALYLRRRDLGAIDQGFREQMQTYFEPYLLAGREVAFRSPRWVPLDIRLKVWVEFDYARSRSAAASAVIETASLLELFQPTAFGFGETVFLSDIVSRVAAITAVDSVSVETFKRWGRPSCGEIETGEIFIESTEIAQILNDRDRPEKGLLAIQVEWADGEEGHE